MFYEIAENYRETLRPFTLYPPITDRTAWEGLAEEWKKEALALGERCLQFDFQSLTATDFMDFTRTGNRVRYETKCFSKRHALNALTLAECVEDKGRFLDDIINGIFSVCEESAWQLPPHNSYIRDTPQQLLPDATAPVLDLFACESGAVLATACYLLESRLDKISPFITKRIRRELEQRIFHPYLESHFWWMGNGKEPMNNWTVWCTQNVLLSAFLSGYDPAYSCDGRLAAYGNADGFQRAVLRKACKSIDYFLAEYGDDGCCDEGAQYYRHAGLCLFNAMEILNAVTDGAFSALYTETKIQNIASYIYNVHIDDKYYVNFADCSPVAGRAGVREFLFALRTGHPGMAAFAAADFLAGMPESLLLPSENNLYYRLQNAFTIREIRAYAAPAKAGSNVSAKNAPARPDIYYPSAGIFLARDSSLCLAVKAGDNGDSHNHNDTGSFTIYKKGIPLFIDIGVESYTKKTFSPQRYEIWTMQSAYHNLPTINGQMQKDGEAYGARDVSYQLREDLCRIEMDIAAAYPEEAGIVSYRRSAFLYKGQEIVIRDRFALRGDGSTEAHGSGAVTMSLMTYEKPVVREGTKPPEETFLTLRIGSVGTLRAAGGRLSGIESIPITDARLQTAWKHEIYRILIDITGRELEMHIS
ncbi:MAG: heparinase II/III-family protein [Blautia sp.]|nr:heparinase II/III-family protein [Blautia sp.]MCM1200816.1 heparinase II/III-family protein [Bacteroides fragilis]